MRTAYGLMLFALLFSGTASAARDNGHVEYHSLINSTSFDNLHSVGFYSPVQSGDATLQVYGVAELSWYSLETDPDYEFNFRVAIGLTSGHTIAPFVEIGTNILDLLYLGSRDEDDTVCDRNQGDDCDADIDVKLGLRYRFTPKVSASLYHQRLHFSDFQETLAGNRQLTGISLGYHF